MEIKNTTTLTEEIIKKASYAREKEDNKYSIFKKIYFVFGIIFALMFIWEVILVIMKSESADSLMMVVYLAASAVLLYIGKSGLEFTAYKNFRKKYINMIGLTFETVMDEHGIKVKDPDGDAEEFIWDFINRAFMDDENVYVDVRGAERLIFSRSGFDKGKDSAFVSQIRMRVKAREEEGIVDDIDNV